MNAKALLALIDECGMIELVNRSGRDSDGWIQETILRALRLLAAAEANNGTATETDAALRSAWPGEPVSGAYDRLVTTCIKAERERNGLAARVRELEPDAERYRWIRHNCSDGAIRSFTLPFHLNCDEPENEWDAAIDAARKP